MTLLILTSIAILILSFLSSSTEAALFTVTPVQVERLCAEKRPGAQRLRDNKERIQNSIIAIVFLNNIANVAGSILVGSIAAEIFSDVWIGIYSAAFTMMIILFGEIAPKVIGERFALPYARASAGFVFALRVVFRPLTFATQLITRPLTRRAGSTQTSEEEIRLLARIGHEEGAIQDSEHRLIHRVFQLNDIAARDIMTPRTVVFALQADRRLSDLAGELDRAHVSRIPVYNENLDDIIGVAHIRNLLGALARGEGARTVRDFAAEVPFIPDTARADALLESFRTKRSHLAVVIDEHGGMAGVLTLEDILEQLVGEIVDEYDRDVDMRARARAQRRRGMSKL
jgi:CBS domain containing-hemolysin-like protein